MEKSQLPKFQTAVLIIGCLVIGVYLVFGAWCLGIQKAVEAEQMKISGKNVLMILASRNFRDEEYLEPRKVLEDSGADITVASSSLGVSRGMLGAQVRPDILLEDVDVADYDAILFIGGSGSSEYFNDPKAHSIAREAQDANKVLGAICIAPSTLANAGVLKGKKATCFASERANLVKKGATYTGRGVEVDGNIITSDGPGSAREFGETILEKLKSLGSDPIRE